ncbi:SAM-dependent methyltransferase [Engelhardtia mirabilis]|uniref:Ribosomal RNA large subunit methyltransferase K n=1 Tax=Engelhardtia mirabilis TaxID=2528011 RepID=A0A518BMY6_9BACT|nr:Ribosomal RNA large subunit methyltransferase K [Planctomycetes bacterium Pla133]QDV02629.1 Ribosomal RNA large subunit methyltransferase K [Planctomycetes bacterium Pla86]
MRPSVFSPVPFQNHALIDSGRGEKLERFGEVLLRRPDPQALWRPRLPAVEWDAADLVFVRESDRGGRFERGSRARGAKPKAPWTIEWRLPEGTAVAGDGGARFQIEPTPFKHVGLFPEQATNWSWIAQRRADLGERPALLNLFGYTGAASVVASLAGYDVTHVDASRASLDVCVANAEASGLGSKPFRVVLEDALAFAEREVRRGKRYAAVLLDPPHYGRGPKGQRWQLEEGLAPLLDAARALVDRRGLLILSTYAVGYSPLAFENLLAEFEGGASAVGELALAEESSGRLLPCGFCARWARGVPLEDGA